jgi:stage II sporulation protein AA (anti-sigma F factor antagonist)
MNAVLELIEVERLGDTLVLTSERDLRELEFEAIEQEQQEVLRRLADDPSIRNVVVDFRMTDCFGSTALKLLIRLQRVVRERGGRIALCNVSAHEREILAATRLDRLWPPHASREEAVEAVND